MINVIFQYSENEFTGYKFHSLRNFVRQLWFRNAISIDGWFQKIPGIHIVDAPGEIKEYIKVACKKFEVKLIDNSTVNAQYVGLIHKTCEDPYFERLFVEIIKEGAKF